MPNTSNDDQKKAEDVISNLNDTQSFIAKDYSYYYNELNPNVERSLSYEQKKAVQHVLKRAVKTPSKKIIDFRTSFWFIKRLYIVVVIAQKRQDSEFGDNYEDKMSIIRFLLKSIVYIVEFMMLLGIIFFVLYLAKSLLGVDINPDKHLRDYFIERSSQE